MIYAIDVMGRKIQATPRTQAICPVCGGETIAKCGKIRIHHWAHKICDCDLWHEPETEWHLNWKKQAPIEHCEVVIGPHRADIKGTRGVVVEIQNSKISPEIIRERESFYRVMVWILNAKSLSYFNLTENNYEPGLRIALLPAPWGVAKMPIFIDPNGLNIRIVKDTRRVVDVKVTGTILGGVVYPPYMRQQMVGQEQIISKVSDNDLIWVKDAKSQPREGGRFLANSA